MRVGCTSQEIIRNADFSEFAGLELIAVRRVFCHLGDCFSMSKMCGFNT